jgi:hypothetical protein
VLGQLQRTSDSTWAISFVPQRQETINVRLLVDGTVASTAMLVVSGQSPVFLDTAASLAQAFMTSQQAAVTTLISNGSEAVAFLGEDSTLAVPIVDKFGSL